MTRLNCWAATSILSQCKSIWKKIRFHPTFEVPAFVSVSFLFGIKTLSSITGHLGRLVQTLKRAYTPKCKLFRLSRVIRWVILRVHSI